MEAKRIERMTFSEAFLGLVLTPGTTAGLLLERERPRHGVGIFMLFLFVLFLPVFYQMYKYRYLPGLGGSIISLCLIILLTCLMFCLIEWIVLTLMGIEVTLRDIFTISAYSLAPVTMGLWLIYLFNYLTEGDLSVITMYLTGHMPAHDQFMQVVPAAVVVLQLFMLLVFFYSIKYRGDLGGLSAFLISLFSLLPFYFSFLIAAFIGEGVRPGTVDILLSVISSG